MPSLLCALGDFLFSLFLLRFLLPAVQPRAPCLIRRCRFSLSQLLPWTLTLVFHHLGFLFNLLLRIGILLVTLSQCSPLLGVKLELAVHGIQLIHLRLQQTDALHFVVAHHNALTQLCLCLHLVFGHLLQLVLQRLYNILTLVNNKRSRLTADHQLLLRNQRANLIIKTFDFGVFNGNGRLKLQRQLAASFDVALESLNARLVTLLGRIKFLTIIHQLLLKQMTLGSHALLRGVDHDAFLLPNLTVLPELQLVLLQFKTQLVDLGLHGLLAVLQIADGGFKQLFGFSLIVQLLFAHR